ncbi:MAG: hypothetical protein ACP5NV_05075 [Candidatus Woesearchaeota archaeon]
MNKIDVQHNQTICTVRNHKFFKTVNKSNDVVSKRGVGDLNMSYLKVLLFSLVFIFLFASITFQVSAASISVTKAVMDYKGVLRGGYAQDFVYVASDTDFDVPIEYEFVGDIKNWISVIPDYNKTNTTIFISRDKIQELVVVIQPPADTPTGNYTGGVRVITGTINRPEGPYGSQLQAAFLIRLNVEIVGDERLSCNIGGITIKDTEIGLPIEFSMVASNNGNVRVWPNVTVDFWNQDQTKMMGTHVSDFSRTEVLPTTSKLLYTTFENNLRIGQYWAYVTAYPCANSELVSFSVLEKGEISDYGDLLRIENKPWASTGEIIPISAIFKNNGERVVSAKFKGVVLYEEKIVDTLDSDFYDVAPGEVANLSVFFTPKKLGQYYISGRVLYNNKLTYEKSSILNVNSGEEIADFNFTYIIVIIIIVIIILLLLIRIKRKKQLINNGY